MTQHGNDALEYSKSNISKQIKKFAISLGFDACGICKSEKIDKAEIVHLEKWINRDYHASMDYLARNFDKRIDPTQLVEGSKSIISVALNYYPHHKQDESVPQIAYYAYGQDYHNVMKDKLQNLLCFIQKIIPNAKGRVFCDTAPVMERYWAARSGIGFVGKNTLLIIPQKGSFFFLGEVIIDQILDYDKPLNISCGSCSCCIETCPTKAIEKPNLLNSNKCISYQTIENKGNISTYVKDNLNNCFYGCDICQKVCPWNKFSKPHKTTELNPSSELLNLDAEAIEKMTVDDYQRIFKGSAIKRAKQTGLIRNIQALKNNKI